MVDLYKGLNTATGGTGLATLANYLGAQRRDKEQTRQFDAADAAAQRRETEQTRQFNVSAADSERRVDIIKQTADDEAEIKSRARLAAKLNAFNTNSLANATAGGMTQAEYLSSPKGQEEAMSSGIYSAMAKDELERSARPGLDYTFDPELVPTGSGSFTTTVKNQDGSYGVITRDGTSNDESIAQEHTGEDYLTELKRQLVDHGYGDQALVASMIYDDGQGQTQTPPTAEQQSGGSPPVAPAAEAPTSGNPAPLVPTMEAPTADSAQGEAVTSGNPVVDELLAVGKTPAQNVPRPSRNEPPAPVLGEKAPSNWLNVPMSGLTPRTPGQPVQPPAATEPQSNWLNTPMSGLTPREPTQPEQQQTQAQPESNWLNTPIIGGGGQSSTEPKPAPAKYQVIDPSSPLAKFNPAADSAQSAENVSRYGVLKGWLTQTTESKLLVLRSRQDRAQNSFAKFFKGDAERAADVASYQTQIDALERGEDVPPPKREPINPMDLNLDGTARDQVKEAGQLAITPNTDGTPAVVAANIVANPQLAIQATGPKSKYTNAQKAAVLAASLQVNNPDPTKVHELVREAMLDIRDANGTPDAKLRAMQDELNRINSIQVANINFQSASVKALQTAGAADRKAHGVSIQGLLKAISSSIKYTSFATDELVSDDTAYNMMQTVAAGNTAFYGRAGFPIKDGVIDFESNLFTAAHARVLGESVMSSMRDANRKPGWGVELSANEFAVDMKAFPAQAEQINAALAADPSLYDRVVKRYEDNPQGLLPSLALQYDMMNRGMTYDQIAKEDVQ